ncbi:hypothetical protein PQR63_20020 [Herbaspirillum rhizosphaerae]|uniref:Uncharacterized protein n=1 Tax=Herbaspirillum rhizosphaerae TaxID=346179 RepID=A0ABW8ZDV9_9BURK
MALADDMKLVQYEQKRIAFEKAFFLIAKINELIGRSTNGSVTAEDLLTITTQFTTASAGIQLYGSPQAIRVVQTYCMQGIEALMTIMFDSQKVAHLKLSSETEKAPDVKAKLTKEHVEEMIERMAAVSQQLFQISRETTEVLLTIRAELEIETKSDEIVQGAEMLAKQGKDFIDRTIATLRLIIVENDQATQSSSSKTVRNFW